MTFIRTYIPIAFTTTIHEWITVCVTSGCLYMLHPLCNSPKN